MNGEGRNHTFASEPVQPLHPIIPPLGLSVKLDLTLSKDGAKKVGNKQYRQYCLGTHVGHRCCQSLRERTVLFSHLTLYLKHQIVTFPATPASLYGSSHIKRKVEYMVHRGD